MIRKILRGVAITCVSALIITFGVLSAMHERDQEEQQGQTSVIYEDGSGLTHEGDVFCLPRTNCTVAPGYVAPPSDAQERFDALMSNN